MRRLTKILLVIVAACAVRIAWEVVVADTYDHEAVSTFLGVMWGALVLWGAATWELRQAPEESRR